MGPCANCSSFYNGHIHVCLLKNVSDLESLEVFLYCGENALVINFAGLSWPNGPFEIIQLSSS